MGCHQEQEGQGRRELLRVVPGSGGWVGACHGPACVLVARGRGGVARRRAAAGGVRNTHPSIYRAPVAVDDHGHIRVTLPVAGLVHADGTQPVEQARAPFGAKIVGDALADRAHTLPVDTHQAAHGAARRMHARPGDLPFEVARVRAFPSHPRQHATVTPCSAHVTRTGACSGGSLVQPMSR